MIKHVYTDGTIIRSFDPSLRTQSMCLTLTEAIFYNMFVFELTFPKWHFSSGEFIKSEALSLHWHKHVAIDNFQ